MTAHAAACELYENHQPWALSIAGSALRRIGPQADGDEIRQVAQVATWERALAFDPLRWTIQPTGSPFELYAYPWVYGACLMVGLRGMSGRAKTRQGEWIGMESIHVGWAGWFDGEIDQRGDYRLNSAERSSGTNSNAQVSNNRTFTEHQGLKTDPNQSSVDTAIDATSRRELIVAILHELPKRERHLIAEHYLAGVSLAAIAESLYTSPSSVSRIHANALDLLRVAVARRGLKAWEWI